MEIKQLFDVIIIGGSYAGLSAAMALGRSLRRVLIIDNGNPCNRQTPYSHNFLTRDGQRPEEISSIARQQVENYDTVQFYDGLATSGKRINNAFQISTQDGQSFTARKLVFAAGIKDIIPDIEGFSACWGISVIHCPYCHGYEYRHRKTGILANGEKAFHIATLVNNLTKDLTVLTSGNSAFSDEQSSRLKQNNITIITKEVVEIEHEDGHLKNVVFIDGSKITFDAMYAPLPFKQNSDIPSTLGCELTEHGYLKVDPFQKTNIKGIYACGDSAAMMRSVANAVYSGNAAGAMINKELTEEQF